MDRDLRDAYLARLGVEPEPPSVDALIRLHRAQVERVPYETLWIHLGEGWRVDTADSVERIATQGRGGYCFHLNGAFSELLADLGYDVVRHVGGVHGPDGPVEDAMANHLVLTVRSLPADDCPDGTWYVDAGLGDALHEPVPLAATVFDQGPFHLELGPSPNEIGDWHLTHDPLGSFRGMAWRSEPVGIDAFAAKHEWLSTSPDSGFVRVLTAQRRDATGVDILRGLVVSRVGEDAFARDLEAPAELSDALADLFGLHVPPDALPALWARTKATHDRWIAAGRP